MSREYTSGTETPTIAQADSGRFAGPERFADRFPITGGPDDQTRDRLPLDRPRFLLAGTREKVEFQPPLQPAAIPPEGRRNRRR